MTENASLKTAIETALENERIALEKAEKHLTLAKTAQAREEKSLNEANTAKFEMKAAIADKHKA
jgi:hypothetical protein